MQRNRFARVSAAMLVDLEYPLIEVAGGRLRRRRHPDPGSEIEEFVPSRKPLQIDWRSIPQSDVR